MNQFATGINDTSGTGGKICLNLQISPRIFEKIRNDHNVTVFSGALGKIIHEKNQKRKKSRDTVPFIEFSKISCPNSRQQCTV
jgi:hypothetical protein